MDQAFAYSTVGLTLGLVVARPRIGARGIRLSPALAAAGGVALLLLAGVVDPGAAAFALADLWRSFVTLAAIMVMTDVAHRIGALEWMAGAIDRRARSSAALFTAVFALAAGTATVINNDAAILLLTPLVITLVQRRSSDPERVVPFAFAVFIAAGVAPMVVSNPMNMIVADYAGIGFNEYAARMFPVAIPGWLIGFAITWALFRRALSKDDEHVAAPPRRLDRAQLGMLLILGAALPAYSLMSYFGGPVWVVACVGAGTALVLAARRGAAPSRVIREGISWNTLAFLFCVLVLALGLANVGLVDRLAAVYDHGGVAGIGVTSALGSALLDNHPMAYLNMLALHPHAGGSSTRILAALIGGDLGPRLLPMGSLAGLMWSETLRRRGTHIGLGRFLGVGLVVTIPTLAASLVILGLLS